MADLLAANNLPLCFHETEAVVMYIAGLVDDAKADVATRNDLLEWFGILAGNKYTASK